MPDPSYYIGLADQDLGSAMGEDTAESYHLAAARVHAAQANTEATVRLAEAIERLADVTPPSGA